MNRVIAATSGVLTVVACIALIAGEFTDTEWLMWVGFPAPLTATLYVLTAYRLVRNRLNDKEN